MHVTGNSNNYKKKITRKDQMPCTRRLHHLATSTTLHSDYFRWQHEAQQKQSFKFAVAVSTHLDLVEGITDNITSLFTVFKEGAGNSFLSFTDKSHPTNPLFTSRKSSAGDI